MKIDQKYVLILIMVISGIEATKSFSALASYVSTLQEYPDADNDDWSHPTFNNLYRSQKPSIFARALNAIGLKKIPYTVDLFKQLLEEVVASREPVAFGGEIVQKIFPGPDEQIVIFGDLQGALHSLMRDLKKLIALGVLSDDLKVTEGNYILFNGNVINGSPYNMETLFLVLSLIKQNPSQIIYIKGAKEQADQWMHSELIRQLKMVVSEVDRKQIELLLERFFNTLPTALYIMQDDSKGIRVDAHVTSVPLAFQQQLSTFFTSKDQPWIMNVSRLPDQMAPIEIAAQITVDDSHKTMGFKRYIGREISSWALFSSPTASNRRLKSFLHDAFAIIETAPVIENWNITFYYHDALKTEHFESPSTYNLIKGDLLYGKALEFFDDKDRESLKKEVIKLELIAKELEEECQKKNDVQLST